MYRVVCRLLVPVMALIILSVPVKGYSGKKQQKPVRMAYLQSDIHHLAFWIALDKGFFEQQGVAVDVAGVFKAGPEVMTGFASGALDMAYVGEAPATTAVANGAARVVVVSQVNTEGSALVVSKEHPTASSVKDLQGKTVAVPGHSTVQDFLLRKALDGAFEPEALSDSPVHIIVIKPPEMIGALRTGQIDAFVAWEPYPSKAFTMGVGRNLVTSRHMWPDHPCCVLAADSKFAETQPERVRAVLAAHAAATRFIHEHPGEAVRIGAKYTGMDEETVKLAMKNVHYTTKLSIEGEKEYVRFLTELRYIRLEDPDAFVGRFIDPKFLAEIQAQ
jgi:NitT/TauT family transport system substrate-binding protein